MNKKDELEKLGYLPLPALTFFIAAYTGLLLLK